MFTRVHFALVDRNSCQSYWCLTTFVAVCRQTKLTVNCSCRQVQSQHKCFCICIHGVYYTYVQGGQKIETTVWLLASVKAPTDLCSFWTIMYMIVNVPTCTLCLVWKHSPSVICKTLNLNFLKLRTKKSHPSFFPMTSSHWLAVRLMWAGLSLADVWLMNLHFIFCCDVVLLYCIVCVYIIYLCTVERINVRIVPCFVLLMRFCCFWHVSRKLHHKYSLLDACHTEYLLPD